VTNPGFSFYVCVIFTIKTVAELRNVGDTAYAISHAVVEHTVAGCRAWLGCRLAACDWWPERAAW